MKYIILGILAVISVEACSSPDHSYICVVEEATGFIYKNGTWNVSQFDESKNKFIIRPLKEDDRGFNLRAETSFGVFEHGRTLPDQFCSPHQNYEETVFACHGLGELFFSTSTGRFIKTSPSGYYDGQDRNDVSPKIMRGKCSKI